MTFVADTINAIFRPDAGKEPTVDTDLRRTTIFLVSMAIIGIAALVCWAASRNTVEAKFESIALGVFLIGGSALVGGVLGLLFGIPKSVSDPEASEQTSSTDAGPTNRKTTENPTGRSSYAVNTNLEQISDWLTKIIVEVGLTELGNIRSQFQALAKYFGNGFTAGGSGSADTTAPVVAALIIVYGLTAGFLAGYLLTRMFLPGAFNRADEALRRRNTELATKVAQQQEIAETSARVQGEIYNDLYRYKDRGFRDAITKIEKLFESPANRKNPALWVYLAAAHGQSWRWEHEHSSAPENEKEKILKQHRDAALDAVKQALELGESWKPILQVMWDKGHPIKASGKEQDDDLEVFFNDPEFQKLLSRRET